MAETINKHSYTQFNSHENKCFYDDYSGYVSIENEQSEQASICFD